MREVLDATLEVLARSGYARVCAESVAERAGVAKTTIYRRWPNKSELVVAALRAAHGDEATSVDSGSLRADLLRVLASRAARLSTPRGRAIARAVLGGIDDPEIAALARDLRARWPLVPSIVVERAIARGELARRTDPAWIEELLTAPLHARVVFQGEPVDRRWLGRLVDVVVRGLAPSPVPPPPPVRRAVAAKRKR